MGFAIDPNLVRDAQHDGAALENLLVALWPEAYRVAFGVLHDRGLAEDAAQEACAGIALGLSSLRATEAFSTWMYRIIIRHAMVSAKRLKKLAELGTTVERRTAPGDDDRLDILAAVAALPKSQRAAVVLRYYAGFNISEIAAVLGAPAATIRFHLMLARRTLRTALAVIDSGASTNLEACPDAR
ncbi:MAG: sigma-70 family RNA polymerase sigma factor [Candidatus Eremiobacteraeota bacterium]|nr:sigma-70 family RNA polymerase sigma factor [Candidatus Eremiobacteraeota bacterium]